MSRKILQTCVPLALATCLAAPAFAVTSTPTEATLGTISPPAESVISNTFDIVVDFAGGLTTSQMAVFSAAEYFWETMITGYQIAFASGGALVTGPTITAQGADLGGVGGVLAQAGPTTAFSVSDGTRAFAYTATGVMSFDIADLPGMESSGTFFDVIVHEMGHVLGFGTLWDSDSFGGIFSGTQSVSTAGSGQYTGAFGLTAYNAEFGLMDSFVPVELDFGPGTADSHWDEANFAGGSLDIMTGLIGGPTALADAPFAATTVSATTIASFADIGYTTIVTHPLAPVPLPAGIGLLVMGLGGLVALRRRKTQTPAAP